MKIKIKISASILLVVVVGGSVALFFVTRLSQQALKQSIGQSSYVATQQAIDSIDRVIYRRIERWQSYVSTRPELIALLNVSNEQFGNIADRQELILTRDSQWVAATADEAQHLLTEWTDAEVSQNLQEVTAYYADLYDFNLFPEVFITNKYGVNVVQTNKTSDYYQADEEWWQQTKQNQIYIIDASYDESADIFSLGLCISIRDKQGNFVGALKAVYNLQDIIKIIDDLNPITESAQPSGTSVARDSSYLTAQYNLINANGNLVYSTDSIGHSYLEHIEDTILTEVRNNVGSHYFTHLDTETGDEELYSYAFSNGYRDYKGLGWVFITEYQTSDIYAPVSTLGRDVLIVIAVSCILAIIVGVIVSTYITRPIELLKKSTDIIKSGNLDHKAALQSRDEIGEFSRAFDQMTGVIRESQKNIEKKVKDQTKEITKQRDQLKVQMLKVEQSMNDLKKFQMAVANASDHIVITDIDGIILYANVAVKKITGYTSKEVLGTKAGKLWSKPMPHDYYVTLWDTIKNKKNVFSGEITNKRKNGEEYIAYASISPVLDSTGKVVFFIGIERDITKEKQIDKAKTEFVSLASHQLRTPLTAINWYSEMLAHGDAGKLTKKQSNFLNEVIHGNHRMIKLVNSLLNVSRIDLGIFAVDPVPTDIRQIAKIAIQELQPTIHDKKIIFKASLPKQFPRIPLDQNLTSIIFQNLLSNAVKYTPEKGSVSLTVRKQKSNIEIIVKDSGFGIPKNQQSKIFTKLFRADNARISETEGTGLGLYVVKSILDEAGGTIHFISKENKGTTFTVTLPLSGMKPKKGTKGLT